VLFGMGSKRLMFLPHFCSPFYLKSDESKGVFGIQIEIDITSQIRLEYLSAATLFYFLSKRLEETGGD